MTSIAPTMDSSRPQTQMYQQQPMMQPQMMYQAPVVINKVVSSKAWHNTKIALGSIILVVDIVIFGLGGGALATILGLVDMAIAYPVAGISLVWQIAEFITLCAHPDRGIHPGAHVGMQLILWLGFAIAAGFLTTFVVFHESYSSYYRGYSSSRRGSLSDYNLWQSLESAITAFLYINLVLHFTLFVRACIECNRRNRMHHTVMVAAPPPQPYYPAGQMMGQMQPQQALYPVQYMPVQQQHQQQHNPHMSMMSQVPAPQQTAREGNAHDSAAFGYYAPPAAAHQGHHETSDYKPDVPQTVSPVHHTGSPAPQSSVSGEHAPQVVAGPSTHGHPTRNLETV